MSLSHRTAGRQQEAEYCQGFPVPVRVGSRLPHMKVCFLGGNNGSLGARLIVVGKVGIGPSVVIITQHTL